ncbi:MAG: radical SAM protein [Bacteroidetes bacterium]|nr:radical SAM protein [Bacteroidota bacterium]
MILFDKIVFGPIVSRRFGKSLGINLLPLDNKVCNFNCIYCECGWTNLKNTKVKYTSYGDIVSAMQIKFKELGQKADLPDVITFAGNGEPTMHPQFLRIIEDTIRLRNLYMPKVKIVILSNGVLMNKPDVLEALLKVDLCVMKFDAGNDKLFKVIDQPLNNKSIDWYVQNLKKLEDKLIIQSIFLKGMFKNEYINSTDESNLNDWLNYIKQLHPNEVMIYTIDRETPAKELQKIPSETLSNIALRVNDAGIKAKVYT